jgi:hypothetical protein
LFFIQGTDEGSRQKVLKAISQNFEGITELSEEFYKVIQVAQKRQELGFYLKFHSTVCVHLWLFFMFSCVHIPLFYSLLYLFCEARQFVRHALSSMDSGFSEFDRTLIEHSAIISTAYDEYYPIWLRSVNNPLFVKDLQEANEKKQLDQKLYNNYTIIFRQSNSTINKFKHHPNILFVCRQSMDRRPTCNILSSTYPSHCRIHEKLCTSSSTCMYLFSLNLWKGPFVLVKFQ